MKGQGFTLECKSSNITVNFVNTAANSSIASNWTIFDVKFQLEHPDATKPYSRINFNTTFPWNSPEIETGVCPTTFQTSGCELRPASVNYTMVYTNAYARSPSEKNLHNSSSTSTGQAQAQLTESTLGYSCANLTDNIIYQASTGGDSCGIYIETTGYKQIKSVDIIGNLDVQES